jgi:hypothetical protein
MDRLNPLSVGLAMAITLVIVNTLCAAAVALWPDGTITVFNSFAHGLDFRAVKSTEPLGLGRFLLGLISVGVIGFLVGAVFAWSHNLLNRP